MACGTVVTGPNPPLAVSDTVVDDYFGIKIADPFRYMEHLQDYSVVKWISEQSDYSRRILNNISGRQELIDRMIERLVNSDRDSIVAAKPIYKSLWRGNEDNLIRIDNGLMPSKYKEPIFMALYGLGCVMEPGIILGGEKLGKNAGLMMVEDPYSSMTANTEEELRMVETLYPCWNEHKERKRKRS